MRQMKAIATILVLLSVGLGVALYLRHTKVVELRNTVESLSLEKTNLNNALVETSKKLDAEQQKARVLEEKVVTLSQELTATSNKLISTAAELAKAQQERQAAEQAAKAEIQRRDEQISALTQQTNALSIEMDKLNAEINKLAASIAETERKLAAAEGDREFLLKELKRLQAEKAELERQFNDLKLLRTQIAKLKEELSISKRLEWIRLGIYGAQSQKGAEKLLAAAAASAPRTNYGLKVELRQDGTATVVTNPPPAPR
jgi:chromosome segregation ATPase